MIDSETNSVLDPEWEEELRRGQEAEGEAGSVEPELEMVHLLRHTREPEALAAGELDEIWSAIEGELSPADAASTATWWRKAWVWWTVPALAATAVLAVVVVDSEGDEAQTVASHDDVAKQSAGSQPERGPAAPPAAAAPKGAEQEAAAEEAPPADEAFGVGGAVAFDKSVAGRGADGDMSNEAKSAGTATARSGSARAFESSYIRLAPQGRIAIGLSVDRSRDELRDQLLAKARGGGR